MSCPLCQTPIKHARGLRNHLTSVHSITLKNELIKYCNETTQIPVFTSVPQTPTTFQLQFLSKNLGLKLISNPATNQFVVSSLSGSCEHRKEKPRLVDSFITAIDGVFCGSLDATASLLKAAPRPVTLTFTTNQNKTPLTQIKPKPKPKPKVCLHPLLAAAKLGDLEKLKTTLSSLDDVSLAASITDKYGSNALHWAAGSGSIEVCLLLLEESSSVPCFAVDCATAGDKTGGKTPLHFAARNGHLEVCKLLVSRGGEGLLDLVSNDGTTVFMAACWQSQREVCQWIFGMEGGKYRQHVINAYGCNATHFMALGGDAENFEYFHRVFGLDLTVKNNAGHGVVHKAAWRGRRPVLEYLFSEDGGKIDKGISVREVDREGWTPIEVSERSE